MNSFEILDKLGDGAYSVVYKVKRKEDNNIYALKKVKLKGLSDKEKQNALNEVRILASVKSNFVISYKEAFIDEEDSSLCLIMEYADKGDLYQKITQFKKMGCLIEEIDVWRIFIQMTKGLKALHDLKILHRDLKSANIFLFSDGSAKIGDLNVSKVVYKGLGYTQTGTPYYASPEVWKDQPYDNKSDIWSLGCITFEMLALRPPFRAENMEKLYNKVIHGQYGKISDSYSQDIKEIIKFMLKVNPQDRPSCGQILSHEFVKKRLEFFKAQAGYDDENMDDIDEGVLLKTIRIPKNILFLTERLPEPNYDKGKGNRKNKNININNNKDKKITFPNNLLPDIKLKFNRTKNQKDIDKNTNNINLNLINKNKGINHVNKSEKNTQEKTNIHKENIDNENENNIDNNNNLNEENNNHNSGKNIRDDNNLNPMIQNNNPKINHDFVIKNNIEMKRNKTNSKSRVMTNDEEKKPSNNIHLKYDINKKDEELKKIFKKDNTYQNLLPIPKNKVRIGLSEKKEYDSSYLNLKKYQSKKKRIIPKEDEFQKYLKSIGLGDMYKLCMPNSVEKYSIKNYNNRYKPKNKYGNLLPNIYSINNNNINKKEKENLYGENKIIPNRRLIPIGKKLI